MNSCRDCRSCFWYQELKQKVQTNESCFYPAGKLETSDLLLQSASVILIRSLLNQILLSWLNTRSSRAGWSLASDCGSELTSPWSRLWSFPQTPHSYFLQMQTFFNFQSNQCYLKQQLPPGALYCKDSTIKQRKE